MSIILYNMCCNTATCKFTLMSLAEYDRWTKHKSARTEAPGGKIEIVNRSLSSTVANKRLNTEPFFLKLRCCSECSETEAAILATKAWCRFTHRRVSTRERVYRLLETSACQCERPWQRPAYDRASCSPIVSWAWRNIHVNMLTVAQARPTMLCIPLVVMCMFVCGGREGRGLCNIRLVTCTSL